jgi:hypothetical protein
MDLVIELDQQGRIWVSDLAGTVLEEAWIAGAGEKADALRTGGLCLLEEKYMTGRWASTPWIRRKSTASCGSKPPRRSVHLDRP